MNRRGFFKGSALAVFAALAERIPGIEAADPDQLKAFPVEVSEAALEQGEAIWEMISTVETERQLGPSGEVVRVWVAPYVRVELRKTYRTNVLDPALGRRIGRSFKMDPEGFPKLATGTRDWLDLGPSIHDAPDQSAFRWEITEHFLLSPEGGWTDAYNHAPLPLT